MFPVILGFLGPGEWAIVLLIVVLFFGAAKIPELARSLGKAKGEFEKGARETREASAKDATPVETTEEARVLKAAKELGIPTDGRSVADIKADVRARLS
jgi:sec-independent protein translocase protein TatA